VEKLVEKRTIAGACLHLTGMVIIVFGVFFAGGFNDMLFIIGIAVYLFGNFIRGFVNTMFVLPITMLVFVLFMILIIVVPFWIAAYITYLFGIREATNILLEIANITFLISFLSGLIFYMAELFRDPKSVGLGDIFIIIKRH
jgi:uncharacterized membrane protein YvlD (DUF360 family)